MNRSTLPGALCAFALLAAPAPAQQAPAAPAIVAGALAIEQPWIRATPAGARVAGGYLRLTNRGQEPDRLVAASLPIAAAGEIHEMLNRDGTMVMREIPGGLAVPPGGTVELRPGGLHVMFTGLTEAVREGETIAGTLVFERAGTVPVSFRVGGLGAREAPPAR